MSHFRENVLVLVQGMCNVKPYVIGADGMMLLHVRHRMKERQRQLESLETPAFILQDGA